MGLNKKEPFFIRKMRKFLRGYDNRKQFLLPKESLLDADVREAKKRIR